MKPKEQIEFVVFALNECRLLRSNVEALAKYGLPVNVFLDSRTTQEERGFLISGGVEYRVVENPTSTAEGMFSEMFGQVDSEWLFLINVDEWPSPRLVADAMLAVQSAGAHVNSIGVPRKWVRFSPAGELQVSRLPRMVRGDYQWRILRHRHLVLSAVTHTPGFVRTEASSKKLPRSSTLYHLDWIVHSKEARAKKVLAYGKDSGSPDKRFLDHYLPERREWLHFFKPLDDDLLEEVAVRYLESSDGRGWAP